METVIRIVEIVAGIGLLIFVHELGHFLAAKWAGVRVDKFALGFGPKILWRKRGETEYSLRAIPLGGFVAMAGEEPGSEKSPEPEREFRNQPPGKRAVIILAGVVMNFITSVVLFTIVWATGIMRTQPVVGPVDPGSPANKAGLQPGDRIVDVDGKPIADFEDLTLAVLESEAGQKVDLTVERNGERTEVYVEPRTDPQLGMPTIGIRPAVGRRVTGVEKDSPAAEAGLRKGDVIQDVDGKVFYTPADFEYYLDTHLDKAVAFHVMRNGEPVTVDVTPKVKEAGTLGLTPKTYPAIGKLDADSPAERAGLKEGDEVTAVDGEATHTSEDIVRLQMGKVGQPLVYTYLRDGKEGTVSVTPMVFPGEYRARIGLALKGNADFTVGAVKKDSPADRAGIQPGDVLTRIDDTSLENPTDREAKVTWGVLRAVLTAKIGEEVKLHYKSGEATFVRTLTVEEKPDPANAEHGIMIEPTLTVERRDVARAPILALEHSWIALKQVYIAIRGILSHRIIAKKAIGGPVGIFGLSFKAASLGINQFIYLLAFIGVNLAAVNAFPLLPLDGGLLLMLVIEKLRGRPINEQWQIRLQIAGWLLLLSLFAVITFNDISRLVSG